jgi:hypothetical protein
LARNYFRVFNKLDSSKEMLLANTVTCEIETSIFYPWEIGHYFRHQGKKYRIEKILKEVKYCCTNGVVSDISIDTPIENQRIASVVVGVLAK